jgi:hypothetical protein
MASPQERAQVVLWYRETKSFIALQKNFLREYGCDALDNKTITV